MRQRDGLSRPPGYFIAFEGPEGCGKTTQLHAARDALVAAGIPVTATREPGGTAIGEQLRAILLDTANHAMISRTEALLLFAARAQHVHEVIEPALDRREVVLCDRFAGATFAYQGYGRGLPLDDLRALQHFAAGTLKPSLTVLLDLPAEVGLARRAAVGDLNRLDAAGLAFHDRVRAGYRALAAAAAEEWIVLDATAPLPAVTAAVLAVLGERLGRDLDQTVALAASRGPVNQSAAGNVRP